MALRSHIEKVIKQTYQQINNHFSEAI